MSLVKWHQEIKTEDKDRYNEMIDEMLSYDDLDERMNICYDILSEVQDNYPIFYPYLEDEIKDLTLA